MELDPKEVLHHLKALGYENVEHGLLQNFIKGIKIIQLFLFSYIIKQGNNFHLYTHT